MHPEPPFDEERQRSRELVDHDAHMLARGPVWFVHLFYRGQLGADSLLARAVVPSVANAPLTATHVARWSVEWSGRAMTTVNRGAPR